MNTYTTHEKSESNGCVLRDCRGRAIRMLAMLNAVIGLLLLTFDGVGVVSVLCCLIASVLYLLIGLGEESLEVGAADVSEVGEAGLWTDAQAAERRANRQGQGAPRGPRLDWTVVDGSYKYPRPNLRRSR